MKKIVLKIDGMSCEMCESHINDAIRNAFLIKKVTSSFKKGETVILADNDLNEESIKAVIEPTGYKIISIQSEPYKKRGLFDFLK